MKFKGLFVVINIISILFIFLINVSYSSNKVMILLHKDSGYKKDWTKEGKWIAE